MFKITKNRVAMSILVLLFLLIFVIGIKVVFAQFYISDTNYQPVKTKESFRMALSVSPFTQTAFDNGYTYEFKGQLLESTKELEKSYLENGATEMYVRIATKRSTTKEDITDGEVDTNANVHTFDQAIALARIAAELNIPLNPEVMCAFTYMDMEKQQAPRFEEYPEIYKLQNGKDWSELSLDEICNVLYAYGEYLAVEILNTGAVVKNWNLGNEANFGFAGVSLGLKTAVNPKLTRVPDFARYVLPLVRPGWLERNIWKYNASEFSALREGILAAYQVLGIDASDVKFSTHIATVVMTPKASAKYFNALRNNGYLLDTAGISFYPSAPSMYKDSMILFKKTVMNINNKCQIPVFIGEFAYPSGGMSGPFAGWNKATKGYPTTEEGQSAIYKDVIGWGKSHGVIGIRYWAADYEDWGTMGLFNFENKHGTPKKALLEN